MMMAAAAACLVLYVTQWGIGLGSDSAVYVAAARNLLSGYGLSWVNAGLEVRPMTLHGPLLPLLFAGLEVIGVDSLATARALNAFSFGIEVLLVGVLIKRASDSWILSLLGGYLVLSSGELVNIHSSAMSDPLYLALAYIGLVLFSSFLSDRKPVHLVWASTAVGLACLTRYLGLSLVLALALSLVLADVRRAKLVAGQLAILLPIGLGPFILWLIRNLVLTGQAAGRSLTFDVPVMVNAVRGTAIIVMNWFLPLRVVEWLFEVQARWVGSVAAGLMLIAVLGWLTYRGRRDLSLRTVAEIRVLVPLLLSFATFLGLIFATSLLSRLDVDIDERILLPAYGLLLVLVVFFLRQAWRLRGWLVKGVIIALCILLVRNKTVYAYWSVRNLQGGGQGYSSAAWKGSATIRALQELSPAVIYADDIAAVYLLADRRPYLAPLRLNSATGELRPTYEDDLSTMRRRIEQEGAVLVLFRPDSLPPELGPLEELTRGLIRIRTLTDGVIYGSSP